MRHPGFYAEWTDSNGELKRIERDGFVCAHCGCAVFVKPMCDPADMGGRCFLCSDDRYPLKGLICKRCAAKGNCEPFERQLERVEARRMLFTDIGR